MTERLIMNELGDRNEGRKDDGHDRRGAAPLLIAGKGRFKRARKVFKRSCLLFGTCFYEPENFENDLVSI